MALAQRIKERTPLRCNQSSAPSPPRATTRTLKQTLQMTAPITPKKPPTFIDLLSVKAGKRSGISSKPKSAASACSCPSRPRAHDTSQPTWSAQPQPSRRSPLPFTDFKGTASKAPVQRAFACADQSLLCGQFWECIRRRRSGLLIASRRKFILRSKDEGLGTGNCSLLLAKEGCLSG